jgi:hypothetical protein
MLVLDLTFKLRHDLYSLRQLISLKPYHLRLLTLAEMRFFFKTVLAEMLFASLRSNGSVSASTNNITCVIPASKIQSEMVYEFIDLRKTFSEGRQNLVKRDRQLLCNS